MGKRIRITSKKERAVNSTSKLAEAVDPEMVRYALGAEDSPLDENYILDWYRKYPYRNKAEAR